MRSDVLVRCAFFAVLATAVVSLKKDQFYCEMSSPCICVSPDNQKIDLTGFNLTLDVQPNQTLVYRPCPQNRPSSDASAIEIVDPNSNDTIPQVNYTTVSFEIGEAVMLVYTNNSNEFDVILSCDSLATNGKEYLIDYQNDSTNHFKIVLKTSQVCGLNLMDAYANSSSDSWTLFFSFFLVVAFVYFVGGSVTNACLFNKMGIDMIPHHEFWSSLYNNIKNKLCGTSMMASAYESI